MKRDRDGHLSDTTVGLYALSPEAVPDRDPVEAHLQACDACAVRLEEVRAFDAQLANPANWPDAGPDPRAAELLAFEERSANEYAEAVDFLEDWEDRKAASAFAWIAPAMPSVAEYRTGGVVRRLCELAHDMCEREPLYALTLAEAAVAISNSLPESAFPGGTIHDLRGEALKETANALWGLGRFSKAMVALDEAESAYAKLPHSGVGMVAVKYVRAWLHVEQDNLEQAEQLAKESAQDALHLGLEDRRRNAQHLLGIVAFERHQYGSALETFGSILYEATVRNEISWVAFESMATGNCYIELGQLAEANRVLHKALTLYTGLRVADQTIRTRWAIARLHFRQGHATEAANELRATIEELTAHGMLTDAATAAVDLAEVLSSRGRPREVIKVLDGITHAFVMAGKLNSALAALAYLKEALATGAASPDKLSHVRKFISRTERQPTAVFLPLPAPL